MNESDNRASLPLTDVESAAINELLATEESPRFTTPVNIRVTSYRNYKHDPEGISVKAVLDGMVRTGILADDSTSEVNQITFKSIIIEKGAQEKTIIEITDDR